MKRPLIIASLCAALSGCVLVNQTYGPDGKPAYSLTCNGMVQTWGSCLEKAGQLCGTAGYVVENASSEEGFIAASNAGATISGNRTSYGGSAQASSFASSIRTRNMLVACRTPG